MEKLFPCGKETLFSRKKELFSTEKRVEKEIYPFSASRKKMKNFPQRFPWEKILFSWKKKLSPWKEVRDESPSLLGKRVSAGLYLG